MHAITHHCVVYFWRVDVFVGWSRRRIKKREEEGREKGEIKRWIFRSVYCKAYQITFDVLVMGRKAELFHLLSESKIDYKREGEGERGT